MLILYAHAAAAVLLTQVQPFLKTGEIACEDAIGIVQFFHRFMQSHQIGWISHESMIDLATTFFSGQQTRLPQYFDVARQLVLGLEQAVHQFAEAGLVAG